MPEVVCDTSPLQYLHQAGLIDLLPRLYDRVLVPEAVALEIEEGLARGVALPDVRALNWITVVEPPAPRLLPLVTDLGPGERSALAVALEHRLTVILDDALARRHAALLGIRLTGTLGVLIRGKREGHLPAVLPVLERLEALGFRLDAETRSNVLDLAGE